MPRSPLSGRKPKAPLEFTKLAPNNEYKMLHKVLKYVMDREQGQEHPMAHFLFDPDPHDLRIKLQNEAISQESLRSIALKMIRKEHIRIDHQSRNRLKYSTQFIKEFQIPAFLEFIGETEYEDDEKNKKPPANIIMATIVSPDKRKPPPKYSINPYSKQQEAARKSPATTPTFEQTTRSPLVGLDKPIIDQQMTITNYLAVGIQATTTDDAISESKSQEENDLVTYGEVEDELEADRTAYYEPTGEEEDDDEEIAGEEEDADEEIAMLMDSSIQHTMNKMTTRLEEITAPTPSITTATETNRIRAIAREEMKKLMNDKEFEKEISDVFNAIEQRHTEIKEQYKQLEAKQEELQNIVEDIDEQIQENGRLHRQIIETNRLLTHRVATEMNNVNDAVTERVQHAQNIFLGKIVGICNSQYTTIEAHCRKQLNKIGNKHLDEFSKHQQNLQERTNKIVIDKRDEVTSRLQSQLDSYESYAEDLLQKWWNEYSTTDLPATVTPVFELAKEKYFRTVEKAVAKATLNANKALESTSETIVKLRNEAMKELVTKLINENNKHLEAINQATAQAIENIETTGATAQTEHQETIMKEKAQIIREIQAESGRKLKEQTDESSKKLLEHKEKAEEELRLLVGDVMVQFQERAQEFIANKHAYKPAPPPTQPPEDEDEEADAWEQYQQTQPDHNKTPPIFGDRNETYASKQQRYENIKNHEMKTQEIEQRSQHAWDGLKQFRKEHFTNIITVADPPQVNIENFYKTIESSMIGHRMPIVKFQDLTATSTCRPTREPLTETADNAVSRSLYQKISAGIPDYCTSLTSLKNTYSVHQDGYAALFSIMRYSCSFLQQLRPPFGPSWHQGTDAFNYLVDLNTFVDEQRRHNTVYTTYEIAAEILQRAAELPEYSLLATTHLGRLQTKDPTMEVDHSFSPHELVTVLEAHRASKLKNNQPIINKMNRGGNYNRDSRDTRDNRDNNKDKDNKPAGFKYRNEVQCKMCKNYGHCIESQVCRAGAQHYHCTNYSTQNKEQVKANATAYSAANNVTKISKVINEHPNMFNPNSSQDEIHDQIMAMARCMNVDSSDEEEEK